MPITDDPTLCAELSSALQTADRCGDHSHAHRARAIVRDLVHDLRLRGRLREAIDGAIATSDPARGHVLRRILCEADASVPGWQSAAYEALGDE